jgi:hypothetical protein
MFREFEDGLTNTITGATESAVWSISQAVHRAMPLDPCRHSVT